MVERQLDMFAASGVPPDADCRTGSRRSHEPAPAELDDEALVAAIPWAGLREAPALAAEAGRRGLAEAVPALEQLCLRFAGFGLERAVPEQVAALRALASVGGTNAARAVARLIARSAVQGPGKKVALEVAGALGAALPVGMVLDLLHDPDPEVRADACRCTGSWPAAVPTLLELAGDHDRRVQVAALCALGRIGRREARPALVQLLREAPSTEVIEAISEIADEDSIILLGRIARSEPALADAAREALEIIDHPRARQIAEVLAAARSE